jgi:DNA-binding FrmR family transcriptional regulator
MAHLVKDRKTLIARINRLSGQLQAIKAKIEGGKDEDCYAVLQQLTAVRGGVNGLTQKYLEGHIREHIGNAASARDRDEAIDELISTLKSFGK